MHGEKILKTAANQPQMARFCYEIMIFNSTTMNLERRINENDPILPEIFQLSRDYCFAISNERTKLLKALTKQ